MPDRAALPDLEMLLETLLAALAARPDDEALRDQAARALYDAGRKRDALALLLAGLVHLNAHADAQDARALPCLCKRCLDPELDRATISGMELARDHAVARGRVLFFWRPVSLDETRVEVRRNVAARMRQQLAPRRVSSP